MGIGELVDAALTLYRRNFLLIIAIAAVVQVPFAALNLILYQLTGVGSDLDAAGLRGGGFGGVSAGPQGTLTDSQISALKGLFVYTGIVVALQLLVVLPLSLAAMSRAVSDRYLDRRATLGTAYRAAVRRGGPLLGAILLVMLLVAAELAVFAILLGVSVLLGPLGALLALAVVVALGVAMALTVVRSTLFAQAIVIEGVGSLTGIRRSWRLTRGAFWRTLGILAVVFLLQAIVGGALSLPIAALTSGLSAGLQQAIGQVVQAIGSVFVSPLNLIALTLVYYDMRIRREAFDIEMLAASL
jgi:hypothetical protein